MNRSAVALIFLALGGLAATLVWMTSGDAERKAEPPVSRSDPLDDAVETISRRIEALEAKIDRQKPAPASGPERPTGSDPALAEILGRLSAIEASLAKPAKRDEPPADRDRSSPAQQKAKDQDLVVLTAAKGSKEPGANTRQHWGWSPREIQETFGKPDGTKRQAEAGHLDWFYWGPDGNGLLQVRFEGGAVIGVWP